MNRVLSRNCTRPQPTFQCKLIVSNDPLKVLIDCLFRRWTVPIWEHSRTFHKVKGQKVAGKCWIVCFDAELCPYHSRTFRKVKGQKVAGKCWIVCFDAELYPYHSRTFRKVKKWRENADRWLVDSVLIADWPVWCTVSSKSKPIKEAGFRKKLSFGK